MTNEHDNLLFTMLTECKNLPTFLDHVFGFLYRRTDFYCLANDKQSTIGLPPGYAEQIVKSTFYKWKSMQNVEETITPKAVNEIEITTTPDLRRNMTNEFTTTESYNGAVYEQYCWSQSLLELDIYIKIPDKTTTKDLQIKIMNDHLDVTLKNGIKLLSGKLCDRCKHNDAIWSLDGTKLYIHLDKTREKWWNCLLQTEPKLAIEELDCSRPYEELPEEAQAKIEELQWNQERKRMGLPTTDQIAMRKVLEKAWNADGSPFTGPFSPNSVQF